MRNSRKGRWLALRLVLLALPVAAIVGAAILRRTPAPALSAPELLRGSTTDVPLAEAVVAALPAFGTTLFPEQVHAGELLRFVVPGAALTAPRVGADTVRGYRRGDSLRVSREIASEDIRWVELTTGGYVEAARVDRLPQPLSGILTPGREGLVRGRVLPWSYGPADLDTVPDRLKAPGYERRTIRLRRGAIAAFGELIDAAAADGVTLGIFSGWRSAGYQADLFAVNLARRGAMQRVSAAPGRSEHQLGTAADMATSNVPVLTPWFADAPAGKWLARRAAEFGVVMTFSRERHEGRGVAFEPWHLRWVGDQLWDESAW